MWDRFTKIDRTRYQFGEGIYLLYFALMVGARAAGLYEGLFLYTILLITGLFLALCKMVITKNTIYEYGLAGILLLVSAIVYVHTGEKGLFVCFATMLGMKRVSVRKTIEVGTIVAAIIIFIKVFLGIFGVSSEIYYPQNRAGTGMMFRHALGYAHPNTMHMNVLMLSMMIIYLVTINLKEKTKTSVAFLASISFFTCLFNFYIFQYSGSRSGIVACLAYCLINMYLYLRNIGLIEKTIAFSAFPTVCFIAIVLPLVVNERVFVFLNKSVFHSRFSIAKYFWSNNSLSLWGIRLNNPNPLLEHYGIDMAQLYLFLQLGVVAFIVVSALTIWFIYECIKQDRSAELAVMLGMLFLGMWEPLLYNLGFKNFSYVFMGAMFYAVLNNDFSCLEDDKGLFGEYFSLASSISDMTVLKRVGRVISVSLLIGIAASGLYVSFTTEPSALYGDLEQNEAGFSFEMEPLYISQEQIEAYTASGDIVIGYVDETVPMYKYDEEIAHMEYDKKVLSIGVWSGIFSMIVLGCGYGYFFRRIRYNGSC